MHVQLGRGESWGEAEHIGYEVFLADLPPPILTDRCPPLDWAAYDVW